MVQVLLDLGMANCEEFVAGPANIIYKENLRLPSDPILDIMSSYNSTGWLCSLKDAVRKLKPPPSVISYAKNVVDMRA